MSDQAASDTAAIVALYSSVFIGYCCDIGSSVFLIYDYAITSGEAVELFVKSTGASALFFSNYIFTFVTYALAIIGFAKMSDERYAPFDARSVGTLFDRQHSQLRFVCSSELYVQLPAVPAMGCVFRTTCIRAKQTLAAGHVDIHSIVNNPRVIHTQAQFGFGLTGVNDPTFGCTAGVNFPPNLSKILTVVSRTCLITSDTLVFLITWYTMGRQNIHYRRSGQDNNVSTFSVILLRNGSIYFLLLFLLNALHLTFTLISIDLAFEPVSYVTQFTEPLTAVLISRFLLDLQAANRKALRLGIQDGSHIESSIAPGSLIFNRVIGSLGSSIAIPEDIDGVKIDTENGNDASDEYSDGKAEGEQAVGSGGGVDVLEVVSDREQ